MLRQAAGELWSVRVVEMMCNYFVLLGFIFVCLLTSGVLGCNKQCPGKGETQTKTIQLSNESDVISEIITVISDACKQAGDAGESLCNHTAVLPAHVFTDAPANITLKYSDVVLDKQENDIHNHKGRLTASIIFTYKNLSFIIENEEYKIIINSTDNLFETTFTLHLPADNDDTEKTCFFQWNNIQVKKFEFSATANGSTEKLDPIISKFQKNHFQEVLNSNHFLEFLNQEVSVCNKESFLHDVSSAFILIIAIKGFIGFLSSNLFCN